MYIKMSLSWGKVGIIHVSWELINEGLITMILQYIYVAMSFLSSPLLEAT